MQFSLCKNKMLRNAMLLSLVSVAPYVSAADGQWTVPICGAPNDVMPGWVPNGDPLSNGIATITSQNSLITVDIDLGNQRYDAHHAHLYSTTNGYTSGSVDVGHSTVCWAYDNETANDPLTAPYNEKALSIANWPGAGSYAADWYKGYIDMIPADGGDWYIMVHMLGGHFATDEDGHLIPWDSSVHEVQGRDSVVGNWGGENDVSINCNARVGRSLANTNVEQGSCLAGTNGSFSNVDEPFLDQNGMAWLNADGSLTPMAIEHGYDLNTQYLFYNFADEGISAQYGGPEGGAGGFLNAANQDPNRCLAWPKAGWGTPHSHGPDETAPVISLNGAANMGVVQFSSFNDPGATASDDRDGNITAAITSSGSVNTNALGVYSITYSVADAAGNSAAVTRNVTVSEYVDTVPPALTLFGDSAMSIEFNSYYDEPGATAFDNDDGDVSADIQITGSVNSAVSGNYTLNYSVFDAAGNEATATRTVTVLPEPGTTLIPASAMFAPSETIVIAYTEGSGSSQDWIGVYAAGTEPSDGQSHSNYLAWAYTNGSEGSEDMGTLAVGDYVAILFSNNGYGHIGDPATFSVGTAPDETAPVISLNGGASVSVEQFSAFSDPGATASDDRDGSVSVNVSGSVDTNTVGSYTVTYSASDAAGNSASTTRTVTVTAYVDNIAPVISLNGASSVSLELGEAYSEAGATASDNLDGDLTANIATSGAVNSNVAGTYTITYSVSDAAGNSASATRSVTVEEEVVELDTVTIGWVMYDRSDRRFYIFARSSAAAQLTLEGFGPMGTSPNGKGNVNLTIEDIDEADVPATITITSANGGSNSKTVRFRN